MDGEVIDALFGLFDEGIAEDFPCQVFGNAADLFQRLINRHGADGDGRVADDPFAGVVNVAAGRQVHDGVRAPADGPDHLVDFGRDIRCHGAVADISIDLDQEIAANRHRFGFRVVDVVGDDRAAAGDFFADKFGRHIIGDFRAKAFAVADIFGKTRTAQILTLGNIFHFRRDDAAAGIMHLADVHAGLCAQHMFADIGEWRNAAAAVWAKLTIVFRADFALQHFFYIAALTDPAAADFGQAHADVDAGVAVGIWPAAVIDAHGRLARRWLKIDFAHGHFAVADVDFLRSTDRASGDANFGACGDVCHVYSPNYREGE